MDKTKICTVCKRELPATTEFFSPNPTGKLGLYSICRKCKQPIDRERRKTRDKKKELEQKKEYYNNDRGRLNSLAKLHNRIRKIKVKQQTCTICNEQKKLQLASIDHTYTENPEDYIWLCQSCHHLYDSSRGEKERSVRVGFESPLSEKDEIATDSKPPEYICTLREQGECGNEGSMDCLKGNSKGERFDTDVCVHGKRELEKLPELCKNCDQESCFPCDECIDGSNFEPKEKPKTEPEKVYVPIDKRTTGAWVKGLLKEKEKIPEPTGVVVMSKALDDLDEIYCIHCGKPKEKFPKVVYQLGSDSKEYIALKKKYDELIEEFLKHWRYISSYVDDDGTDHWEEVNEVYKGMLK